MSEGGRKASRMISVTLDRMYRTFLKKLTVGRVIIAASILCFLFAKVYISFRCSGPPPKVQQEKTTKDEAPTYMLHGDHVDSGYLKHVIAVLERMGLRRVHNSSDFDLLWSHVYPFGELAPFPKPFLQNLRPYQKVNHFPGSGYFTNKVDLAISDLKYVPRAFQLPSQKAQLLEYSKNNPNHLFVQKSNSHRGIKILKVEDMNLNQAGTFVQEYVQNPFLIDGLKFDIGIYTVLTSVDPLRVYIYNADVLLSDFIAAGRLYTSTVHRLDQLPFVRHASPEPYDHDFVIFHDLPPLPRFCSKKYEPFDPEDIDKYVVGDDYIPIWEMPSLKKSYNERKFGMKETLNIYVRKIGKNPDKIWEQIENSITNVFLEKEEKIMGITKRYKNVGNFFEMVRFDYILDSDLNVYLMETNMSPNLSSDHFPPNRLLYENVLFGLFSLVGVGKRTGTLTPRSIEEDKMEVPEKNLMVFGDECSDKHCDSCGGPHCALCKHCLTTQSLRTIKHAYLEYINKMDYKRIFPPKINPKMKLKDIDLENYSPENRFMMLWFLGKCHQDKSWC